MIMKKKRSTMPHSTTARRRRKESGRKRVTKGMMDKNASIAAEKGIHQASVGCWIRTRARDLSGLMQRSTVGRKRKKSAMQQSVIPGGDLSYY
jgi:hypothetical protein